MALARSFQVNREDFQALADTFEASRAIDLAEIGGVASAARRAIGHSRSQASDATEMAESRFAAIEGGTEPTIEEAAALVDYVLANFDEQGFAKSADSKPKRKRRKSKPEPEVEDEDEDDDDNVVDLFDDDDDDEDFDDDDD